ncbi:MAG: hypothetical protein JWN75_1205 [Candidatus Saccharibacteria bacterium]|nr:hypothetical protein [Candidatus Saccharibacteria bacterium]
MANTTGYPNIIKACLLIAVDCGALNRTTTQADIQRQAVDFLAVYPYFHNELTAIDTWLGTLTEEQLNLICVGDQDEAGAELMETKAPPFTDTLLNNWFEVC